MENIVVRAAKAADIPGICHVNRGEDGPWAEIGSCKSWVANRLKNGFYIQVAELDGRIIAHGEWIVSDERRWKTFYLGQLQVDPDYQFRGAGRRMLADGIARARANGCASISLIPEQDTNSQIFYEKCGLIRGKTLYSCALSAEVGELTGQTAAEAPFSVIRELPFMFGLSQTAAHHMWQVYNLRPSDDDRQVDTLVGDGYCLQLGGFSRERNALLLAWAREEKAAEAVRQARAFAYEQGYPGVSFRFFPEQLPLFPGACIEEENYEMYMEL